MTDKIFSGILIPHRGPPTEITLTLKEIESLLECEHSSGQVLEYLNCFGYNSTIFRDSFGSNKGLINNPLATLLVKEQGPLFGKAIIIDDEQDLLIEDFRKIIEI